MRNDKKRKRARYFKVIVVRVGIFLVLSYLAWILWVLYSDSKSSERQENCDPKVVKESDREKTPEKEFSADQYPDELLELLQKNPETKEFVLNYPAKKNSFSRESLKELNKKEMPLLIQWDERWGYYQYGDNVMGLTGCGPTCLSMVASFLLQDPELTPIYMADYAKENGYCVAGSGSSWELMSKGAAGLGLKVWEVPLAESRVKEYLRQGHPIICIMGPGKFTDSGHFIVLTGLENDKIKINDPNSKERSGQLWEFEEIKSQIRNMWVYFKA